MTTTQRKHLDKAALNLATMLKVSGGTMQGFLSEWLEFLKGFSLHVHVLVTGKDEVDVTVNIRDVQDDDVGFCQESVSQSGLWGHRKGSSKLRKSNRKVAQQRRK